MVKFQKLPQCLMQWGIIIRKRFFFLFPSAVIKGPEKLLQGHLLTDLRVLCTGAKYEAVEI